MTDQIVIGIGGKKTAGKDFTANIIKEFFESKDEKVQLITFADTLRDVTKTLGIDVDGIYASGQKDSLILPGWNMTLRELLQYLGTDCLRSKNENVWVDSAHSKIDPDANVVIFTDVRFENEIKYVESFDRGSSVYINNPLILSDDASGHSSEQLSPCVFLNELDNDYTDRYRERVLQFANQVFVANFLKDTYRDDYSDVSIEDIEIANKAFDVKSESFSNSKNKSVLSVLNYKGESMRLYFNHAE